METGSDRLRPDDTVSAPSAHFRVVVDFIFLGYFDQGAIRKDVVMFVFAEVLLAQVHSKVYAKRWLGRDAFHELLVNRLLPAGDRLYLCEARLSPLSACSASMYGIVDVYFCLPCECPMD